MVQNGVDIVLRLSIQHQTTRHESKPLSSWRLQPLDSVRDVDVILDSELLMAQHIGKQSSMFFHLFWKYLHSLQLLAMGLTHDSDICHRSAIWELGAGAGLTSLTAVKLSEELSAVVLTDNNDIVLGLLNRNIDINYPSQSAIPPSQLSLPVSYPSQSAIPPSQLLFHIF